MGSSPGGSYSKEGCLKLDWNKVWERVISSAITTVMVVIVLAVIDALAGN